MTPARVTRRPTDLECVAVGTPVVAVVMRTKDRPRYLERAIASVRAQTLPDFELVIVNDGGSPTEVDEFVTATADPRIRVIHNARSTGMVAASNRALDESDSEFVAVHDDDDSWHPTFLERTTGHLRETGAMGVIATTDKVVEELTAGEFVTLGRTRLFPGLRFINLYRMCSENYATPIAFVYRRSALDEVGAYDERFGGAADWEFGLRFLQRYEIEFLASEEALALYHHRPEATGIDSNSVYTGEHRRAENRVANEALRADLAAGGLGLGFVLNALRTRTDADEALFERQKHAMDDRVEYLAACIAKVDQRVEALQHAVTPSERLKADLAFLRGMPRTLLKRLGRG
jgi:glycosyltransferase involved in cell wall biosynthesis